MSTLVTHVTFDEYSLLCSMFNAIHTLLCLSKMEPYTEHELFQEQIQLTNSLFDLYREESRMRRSDYNGLVRHNPRFLIRKTDAIVIPFSQLLLAQLSESENGTIQPISLADIRRQGIEYIRDLLSATLASRANLEGSVYPDTIADRFRDVFNTMRINFDFEPTSTFMRYSNLVIGIAHEISRMRF